MELPKSRQQLKRVIENYMNSEPEDGEFTKGCLLAHYRTKTNKEFCEYFRGFYGEKWSDSLNGTVRSAINKIDKHVIKKAGNISKPTTGESVMKLLNEKYTLPLTRKRPLSDVEPADSTPDTPPATPPESEPSTFDYITPKRSCIDCHVMRRESSSLRKELGKTKNEAEQLRSRVAVKFQNEPRVLNQTIKRLKTQIKTLRDKAKAERNKARQEIRELQKKLNTEKAIARQVEPLTTKIGILQEKVIRLKDQKAHTKAYHSGKNSDSALSKQLKAAQLENKSLMEKLSGAENRVLELEEKLNESIETMDGRQFDVKTRKCINYCTEKNVSHQNASELVRYIVHEMTGKTLGKLPAPSTNANIAREFGVISDIQCGVVMSESTNVTFGWDGTTKVGMHLNEKNLSTSSGSLTLGVSEMGGGKAVDYAKDIRNVFTDVSNRYSACFNTDPTDTNKKFHDGKKKNTSSADRLSFHKYIYFMIFAIFCNVQ